MKIILPFTVTIPRKTKADKVFALNLNNFRNAHHFVMNQAKILWKDVVKAAVDKSGHYSGGIVMLVDSPFTFTYTAYPDSNRKFDLGNVLPAVQKFTDDALIELGIIPDDSYKVIPAIDYRFGGVDKENPRIELEITGC
jgi:hypothetical protein